MKYGILAQQNPAYAQPLWKQIDDLYVGGFQILGCARDYIPQQIGEPLPRYEERLKLASYLNYLGLIVDTYAANLFAQEPAIEPARGDDEDDDAERPTVDPYWHEFAANADLRGSTISKLMRGIATTAMLKRRALIGVDFPAVEMPPDASRLEEDVSGAARGYAFEIPLQELIDWEYAGIVTRKVELSNGEKLEFSYGLPCWAILRQRIQKRLTPEDLRDTCVEEFKVWRLVDGYAYWETYEIVHRGGQDGSPSKEAELEPVASGRTSFTQIPILEICVPDGLWLGNKIGPLALEHFRRRSALNASEDRHLFPIPTVYLGPEVPAVGGALPSEAQQNPGRGEDPVGEFRRRGFLVLGKDDKLAYEAPAPDVYETVDKQLSDLVDEMFRVAAMMSVSISSTQKALGRSGASKQEDHHSTAVVLEAYAAIVKDAIKRVYDVITSGRKESIVWKIHGLDKFDAQDRQGTLDEAKTLGVVNIPSKTFKAHWQTKVALSLLGNVPPHTAEEIQEEIARSVVAEEQIGGILGGEGQDDDGDPDEAAAAAGTKPPTQGAPEDDDDPPASSRAAPSTPTPAPATKATAGAKTYDVAAAAKPDRNIAEAVYQQLLEDFPPDVLGWVRAAHWEGPVDVPLDQIDFANRDQWRASKEPDRVDEFVDMINDGKRKPIILVDEPNNDKLMIVDGHHRALAYEKLGRPAIAYVAKVGSVTGPWDEMHAAQRS